MSRIRTGVVVNRYHSGAASNLRGTLLALGLKEAAIATWREARARGLRIHPGLENWMHDKAGLHPE